MTLTPLSRSIVDRSYDVTEAAFAGRIVRFAGAMPCLDLSLDFFSRRASASRLDFFSDVPTTDPQAIANGGFFIRLLCAHANKEVIAVEGRSFAIRRGIDHVAAWGSAKVVLRRGHRELKVAHQAL